MAWFQQRTKPSFDDILDMTHRNLPWWSELTVMERAWADLYLRDICQQIFGRYK